MDPGATHSERSKRQVRRRNEGDIVAEYLVDAGHCQGATAVGSRPRAVSV